MNVFACLLGVFLCGIVVNGLYFIVGEKGFKELLLFRVSIFSDTE